MGYGNAHQKQEYLLTLVFQNEARVLLFKIKRPAKRHFFSFRFLSCCASVFPVFIQCTNLVHSMLFKSELPSHPPIYPRVSSHDHFPPILVLYYFSAVVGLFRRRSGYVAQRCHQGTTITSKSPSPVFFASNSTPSEGSILGPV